MKNRRHHARSQGLQESESQPHWQLHIPDEAYSRMSSLPPLDVLYLDWLEWLEPAESPQSNFANAVSAIVHKVKDGGLVVLDHKHIHIEGGRGTNTNDVFVHLNNGSMLANQGLVEWLAPDLYGDYHSHMATVFKVHTASTVRSPTRIGNKRCCLGRG